MEIAKVPELFCTILHNKAGLSFSGAWQGGASTMCTLVWCYTNSHPSLLFNELTKVFNGFVPWLTSKKWSATRQTRRHLFPGIWEILMIIINNYKRGPNEELMREVKSKKIPFLQCGSISTHWHCSTGQHSQSLRCLDIQSLRQSKKCLLFELLSVFVKQISLLWSNLWADSWD